MKGTSEIPILEKNPAKKTPEEIKAEFQAEGNPFSRIRRVIGVASGKGGVGKSSVTAMLAVAMHRRGYRTAVLDADITGPSIPRIFGLTEKAVASEYGVMPVMTEGGIGIMSINFLLENETDPVLWRGPILAATVKQFWSDIIWGAVDVLFVDMPPGTGDVPLTVYQSLPLDGIVLVTSPQELVTMVVEKALKMAKIMDVPICGMVENYAYFECPESGKRHAIFGESRIEDAVKEHDLPLLGRLPIDPLLSRACDDGALEAYHGVPMEAIDALLERAGLLFPKEDGGDSDL